MGICIKTNAKLVSCGIKTRVNLVCSLSPKYTPLLVDEGFVLVDHNNNIVKVYVEQYGNNRK